MLNHLLDNVFFNSLSPFRLQQVIFRCPLRTTGRCGLPFYMEMKARKGRLCLLLGCAWPLLAQADSRLPQVDEWELETATRDEATNTSHNSLLFFEGSAVASQPISLDLMSEDRTVNSIPRSSHRKRLPFFLKLMRGSLALLLCVSLLTIGWQHIQAGGMPSVAKEEAERFPGAEIEEAGKLRPWTPERLKALIELLPAAENLVEVVDTAEARELLKTVHGSTSVAETEMAHDREELDSRLEGALEALRNLHQVARKQAQAIVEKAGVRPQTLPSLLSYWEIHVAPSWMKSGKDTIGLLQTCRRIFKERTDKLFSHLHEIHARGAAKGPFRDERDADLLRSAAVDLMALQGLQHEMRDAIFKARNIDALADVAVETLLRGAQGYKYQVLQSNVAIFEIILKRKSQARKRGADDSLVEPSSAGADANVGGDSDAESVDARLLEARQLWDEYKRALKNLQHSTTLGNLVTANAAAVVVEQALENCLRENWELLGGRGSGSIHAEFVDTQTMKKLLSTSYELAKTDFSVIEKVAEVLKVKAGNGFPVKLGVHSEMETNRNTNLANELVKMLDKIREEARNLLSQAATLAESLEEHEKLGDHEPFKGDVLDIVAELSSLALMKIETQLLLLKFDLVAVLENDMVASTTTAGAAALRASPATQSEYASVLWLNRKFDDSRRKARRATTLEEAAQAAGEMWEVGDRMRYLVYTQDSGSR